MKKKSHVFAMRITPEIRQKLEDLASNKAFRYNHSAVVAYLIDAEHSKILKQNEN